MEPPPFFPTDVLLPVSAALEDLADASRGNGVDALADADAAPPGPARSASGETASPRAGWHAAARLAEIIAGRAAGGAPAQAGGEREPVRRGSLARELALLHAHGVWADGAVAHAAHRRVARALAADVARAVYAFAVEHHIPAGVDGSRPLLRTYLAAGTAPLAGGEGDALEGRAEGGVCARVWSARDDARSFALRCALAARYGSVDAAPSAAAIAGAPLVLFLSGKDDGRVSLGEDGGREGDFDAEQDVALDRRKRSCAAEWHGLVAGACVFERLVVESPGSLRLTVTRAMKDAIKSRGLSPTLVVLEADSAGQLCASAELLQAVCTSYGAVLHVEGPALAFLAADNEVMSKIDANMSPCVGCDSVLFDVGSNFGFDQLAVVSLSKPALSDAIDNAPLSADAVVTGGAGVYPVEEVNFSLAKILALWWLIERVSLSHARRVISAIADANSTFLDRLAVLPSKFLSAEWVSGTADVMIFYGKGMPESDMSSDLRSTVLSGLCAKLAADSSAARSMGMRLATVRGEKGLLLSPLCTGLRLSVANETDFNTFSGNVLATECVAAAAIAEISQAGASAFLSTSKQWSDVEIVTDAHFNVSLCFGAIRVVPFGLAGGHGRWQQDEDKRVEVEKLTCALAAALDTAADIDFKGVLAEDSRTEDGVPILCIRPNLAEDQASLIDGGNPSQSLEFHEKARDQAQRAAEYVCEVAALVIKTLDDAATVASPAAATDGVLPGTFAGVEVQSAEAALRKTLPRPEDDEKESELPAIVEGIGETGETKVEESDGKKIIGSDSVFEVHMTGTTSGGSLWERLFGPDEDDDDESDEGIESPAPGDFFRP